MKRIVLTRPGAFEEEGNQKGHLSSLGRTQIGRIICFIKWMELPPKDKILILSSETAVFKESAEIFKEKFLASLITDERWKTGYLDEEKEAKEMVKEILQKMENYDLIIIVTSSKNIENFSLALAQNNFFKNYRIEYEKEMIIGNFTGQRYGCEVRWFPEDLLLIFEPIEVDL